MGMTPVFAVYSTFLQRAYDQLVHDVAIGNLHVVLGVDRAGIVGEDGKQVRDSNEPIRAIESIAR